MSEINNGLDIADENVFDLHDQLSSAISKPPMDKTAGVTYSWSNLNVEVKAERKILGANKEAVHILKNVSGLCQSGQLLAIMGASGAGKTTLLNVLTFRASAKLKISGDIRLNHHTANGNTIAGVSAYVQQLDLFTGVFTVREQLNFYAQLRMGKGVSAKIREARVEEVIKELGLRKCADNMIGIPGRIKGISGGEKKRLAFACELITDPMMLLCDEPTSGLDSFMAQNVMKSMKSLAQKGKTVISTIHQPSSEVFAMFDRLMVLSEGRVAFLGDVKEAHAFFESLEKPCPENFNPGDHFIYTLAVRPGIETECKEYVNFVCDEFSRIHGESLNNAITESSREQTADYLSKMKISASPYRSNWFDQFAAMMRRGIYEVVRDPIVTIVKIVISAIFAFIFGSVYFRLDPQSSVGIRNISGALFMIVANISFSNMFPVITLFSANTPLFLREHWNGLYRTDVYFITKSLVELPVHIAIPVIYTAVIYYMTGLRAEAVNFFSAMLIVTLIANTAVSYGMMISCMAKDPNTAVVLSTPLLMPLFLFGGFYIQPSTIPVWLNWISYISWFNYGMELLTINEFQGLELCGLLPANVTQCVANTMLPPMCVTCPTGDDVIQQQGFDTEHVFRNYGCIVALLVGFRALGFCLLLMKTYRK